MLHKGNIFLYRTEKLQLHLFNFESFIKRHFVNFSEIFIFNLRLSFFLYSRKMTTITHLNVCLKFE